MPSGRLPSGGVGSRRGSPQSSHCRGWGNEIDIALYVEVLRRHRTVVFVGAALTLALVVLSVARVSSSGISYRTPQIWSNQSTLVLTQEGAPELRSVLPAPAGGGSSPLADTSRFAGLIDVYTTLATSDSVMRVLERRGLIKEQDVQSGAKPITSAAVVSTVGGGTTPMMTITGTGLSGATATALTRAATSAFLGVVRSRQLAARIPVKDRIQPRVVKSADEPTLVKPRSKAMPILVLLGGLIATAAVAFTRDNVARRQAAPVLAPAVLTTAGTGDEPAGHDSSGGVGDTRSTLGPVPGAAVARGEAGASMGAARGRSTLGSVPRVDSPKGRPFDVADEVAQ